MTGLRRGQLCGLRWADVDLDAGRLGVRQTITTVDHEPVEGPVKTPRSRRGVDLDPTTVATLRAHRARQLEQRMLIGNGYTDRDLVFAAPDGAPWNPDSIGRAFARAVARTDLPRIRLHDLRHSHATQLLAAGTNVKLVSERLGHRRSGSRSTCTRMSLPASKLTRPPQLPRSSTRCDHSVTSVVTTTRSPGTTNCGRAGQRTCRRAARMG
jgi:integrase